MELKNILRVAGTLVGVGFFVIFILSISGTNSYQQQAIPNASGSTNTALVKTCNPLIPLPANPISGALCGTLSANIASSSTTQTAPVTVSSPITITPQKNQTVVLSSSTSSVSVLPSTGQTITITNQNSSPITVLTSNGQSLTSSSITVSQGVTLTSNKTVVISTTTAQPILVTPQNGGSVKLTTNSTSSSSTPLSIVSSDSCPNGGVPVGNPAVCPSTTTPIPPPICTIQQISNGYTVSGTSCIAPPPACTQSQLALGYTINGNNCVAPPTEPISITPIATLADNLGNTQPIPTTPVNLQLQQFISPAGQAVNVDHGQILFSLKLKGKPNTMYQSNGTLKVYINSNSLHPQGIFWAINSMTDGNGEVLANLQLGSTVSTTYTMNIADRASLLIQPANLVNFTLSNMQIQNMASQRSFHSTKEQVALSVELDFNAIKIIKTNSQGQPIRGYPDDDTFKLTSQPQYIAGFTKSGITTGGKQYFVYVQDQTILGPVCYYCNVNIYLENQGPEKLIGTTTLYNVAVGSTPSPIYNIPWDSDIKVILSGGQNGVGSYSNTFHTPPSHIDYAYSCVGTLACTTNLP